MDGFGTLEGRRDVCKSSVVRADDTTPVSGWGFMLRGEELDALAALLGSGSHPTVLLAGEAGVGKSRLAERALELHLAGGGSGSRCVASSSLADVPFGALVGLIPAHHMAAVAAGTQQLSVFAMVSEHILRSGATADRRFVVFVDDLHHLDDASCGLLVQLTGNAPVQLLATYRTGEALPDGAVPLWTATGLVRLEVGPFDRSACDEIVRCIMGAATPEVHEALWQQSRGNALYLRELVVGSVAAGRIAQHGGTWVLAQPLVGSMHLTEYLLQSVRSLEPGARHLADMLALCQPLPMAMFDGEELGALDQLMRAGVVSTSGPATDLELRLSHPIYAEVIRTHLSAASERQLLSDVVRRVSPHLRAGDDLRLTVWQLDAGGAPNLEALVSAARSAMAGRDLLLASRLTRAAQAIVPHHPAASLVLSDALYEMGAFTESAAEATAALGVAADPDEQALLVASLYRTYMWGLDDADGALAVVEFAQAVTPPGPGHVLLGVAAANALSFSDRPAAALDRLQQFALDALDHDDRLLFDPVEEATLSQLGRTADAVAAQLAPTAVALHHVVRSFSLTEHGRPDEASELAQALRADVVGLSLALDRMWAALNAGRAHLMAGRPRSAALWAGDAMITAERAGLIVGQSLIVSVLATAHAQLGEADAVARYERRAEELAHVRGFLRAERAVGRAWAAHVRSEHTLSRQLLLDGAAMAKAAGQVVSESFLLHEHLRLGGEPMVARLAELAIASQSPLVAARAAHAAAATSGDAEALADAAAQLVAVGARLAAAEAYTAAARCAAGAGRQVAAFSSLADRYRQQCEGAVTPMLDQRDAPAAVALSRREQEIAALAVSGLSAREISERLFLSVRTVENHLQRVYTKLGLSNRNDLASYYSRP